MSSSLAGAGSMANDHASLPIAFQLYLPEEWAQDSQRRAKAGVPETVAFHSKPTIALAQIRAALLAGVSPAVVLADAGYGSETAFRTALTKMGLTYIVGIASSTVSIRRGTPCDSVSDRADCRYGHPY